MKKEIKMEVKLTDGYEKRFTEACLKQIRNRKKVNEIENGNEGRADHVDRSGQHSDGDHKVLECNAVRQAKKHDGRGRQQRAAG